MLERKLSPEQIADRCKVEGIEMVSHETLYKWIWKDKRTGGGLHAHLRRQGRKYRHRGVEKDSKGELIVRQLEINFYFCKLYHLWERGANENTNGLIRQYIPKGTDFSGISDEYVAWVENQTNNRPRKRLGYLTPQEKLKQILKAELH